MREVYKNPLLYYLLIPVLVGLWPLLVWGVYLPQAESDLETEGSLCVEGQTQVIEILRIDPDRPNPTKGPGAREFTYASAVDQAANLCKIPSSSYIVNAGGTPSTSDVRKRQDARIKLTNVGIIQAAKFLSHMQSMWVTLQCQDVKLQRKKGMPDQWDVDFRFIYYY